MGRPVVYYVKKIQSYVQNSDHGSHEVGIALDFQNLKLEVRISIFFAGSYKSFHLI